ncbi:unnamed protein product [Brachionus calyciflorus]|uniref:Uncharacterized protein n=1 Tax=Brachionus calyciflorus TaxID=104777 RepID=A0A813M456_9BILA|nr:unnamed protein product [Brachionus calyciflorus]
MDSSLNKDVVYSPILSEPKSLLEIEEEKDSILKLQRGSDCGPCIETLFCCNLCASCFNNWFLCCENCKECCS